MKMRQILKHVSFEAGKMVLIYTESCKFGELRNSLKNKQNVLKIVRCNRNRWLIQMVKQIIRDTVCVNRSNCNCVMTILSIKCR